MDYESRQLEELMAKVSCVKVKDKYILSFEQSHFKIGQTIFDIIETLSCEKNSFQERLQLVKNKWGYQSSELLSLLSFDKKIKESSSTANSRKNYIYLKVTILKGSFLLFLQNAFEWLFNPIVFKILLALSLISTATFFLIGEDFFRISDINGAKDFWIVYGSILSILLFHEVGHASCAKYHQIKSSNIGFGIYMIFPVFYSDVSAAWQLEPRKRIQIDFGGIYFQLILNLILISIYFLNGRSQALNAIVVTNTIIGLFCFNPFLRNDGYWMFADLFDITNLLEKSFNFPIRLYKLGKLDEMITTIKSNKPLALYSICNYVFFVFFGYYAIVDFLPSITSQFFNFLLAGDFSNIPFMLILKFTIAYFFITRIAIRYFKYFKVKILKLG